MTFTVPMRLLATFLVLALTGSVVSLLAFNAKRPRVERIAGRCVTACVIGAVISTLVIIWS